MGERITTVLITGKPGVGKTTMVRRISEELQKRHTCRGFYTEEVRDTVPGPCQRIGFDVVSLQGERGILSRVIPLDGRRPPTIPTVGKYFVYVQDFEKVALPLLEMTEPKPELLIIDEIGKMELLSKEFNVAVSALVEQIPILATIPDHAVNLNPLEERLRKSPSSKVFEINTRNRNDMKSVILEFIEGMLQY